MRTATSSDPLRTASLAIIATGVVITGLVYGRNLLVPLALAILVWNLLAGLAGGFHSIGVGRVRIPKALAALLAVASVVAGGYAIGYVLLGQADAVAAAWPRYTERFAAIVADLTAWLGPERSQKIRAAVASFNSTSFVLNFLTSAGSFVGTTLQIIAYLAFFALERRHAANKIIAMHEDAANAEATARMLGEIASKVQRYIWIKTVVSSLTGVGTYAVLRFLGVDFAETWGLLAFVLNYIPYIGTYVAVIIPVVVSLVQFDAPSQAAAVLASLMVVQTLLGSILDPMLTGKGLNLSPLAIIISLIFWGALWGVVGMVLSVPILAVFAIVCANVPAWRWIAVLLSEDGKVAG